MFISKTEYLLTLNMIKSGIASPDLSKNYRFKDKFVELWRKREKSGENGEGMDT